MTDRVLKYIIDVEGCELLMPKGARVIRVSAQMDQICLWAIGDLDQPKVPRLFYVAGTGHPIPPGEHLGSADCGPFVWHVFGDQS